MTRIVLVCLLAGLMGGCAAVDATKKGPEMQAGDADMQLGNFSVSLTVKDLSASRAFYEQLGFRQVSGDAAQNWLVMKSGTTKVGLFQGMFDKNMLTFNPGWDSDGATLPEFEDVREIQRKLKERGVALTVEADETTSGPAYLMMVDPDGNPILIDQHVARPEQ